ncbi:MAG: hypothetical protein RML38_03125 [Bacteroidia bacterium]|nr:hypothetical protein [Bacteroidia bacterium]
MKGLFILVFTFSLFLTTPIRVGNLVMELPDGFEIPKGSGIVKEKNTLYFKAVGLEEQDVLEFKVMPRISEVSIETAKKEIVEKYKPETDYGIENFKTPFFKGHIACMHNNEANTLTHVAVLRNDLNAYHIVLRQMYKSKQQGDKVFKKFLNSVEKAPVKIVHQNDR